MRVIISVAFSSLHSEVQRHLSVIGKRQYNKEGVNEFSQITVSSAEKDIFNLYMQSAAQQVVANIEQFVSAYTETESSVTFNVTNTRWEKTPTPVFTQSFVTSFKKYLVFYTVSEYLAMNFPELAKKYYNLALQKLQAIIQLVFFKAPFCETIDSVPSASVSQTLTFETEAIGTTSFQFRVPFTSFYDVFHQWNNMVVSLADMGERENVVLTLLKGSNGEQLNPQNPMTITIPWTATAYYMESIYNAMTSANETEILFRSSAILEDDILTFTYSETYTT